jgi:tyrocidine synthetase-3
MDDQVKIRGYRIELGEIEKVLLSHENIKEAVVIAKEINNDKELIAYLVVNGNITADDLREYIGKVLPDFMVPSYFVQLQNIPLSPNGKVDKKALPDPDSQYLDSGVEFVSQQNEAEEKLTEIWKEILGRKNIGVLENFFSIGGHSLKVTELVARVQQTFNLTLSFDTVFNNPTIRGIAEYINDNLGENESDLKKITPLKQQEYYPITYEQRGIYLASQLIKLFNTPFVVKIEGDLDIDRLEHSFKKLIERHESLRTSFHVVNGEVVQKIHESVEFKLIYLEGNESEIENIAKNFISPFSLAEAPLIKVGIMKLNNNNMY